jgi:hypothetical protein
MKSGKAFLAGVIGGLAMTILFAVGRAMGMKANAEMMLGTMFGAEPSAGTWILGLFVHLMLSGLIALAYAVGFEYVAHRSGWLVGVGFSLVHIAIAGIVMAMIPAIHPMVPEKMPAPGAFMASMGPIYAFAFVLEHLIYGAIVGALYGPLLHPRDSVAARQIPA